MLDINLFREDKGGAPERIRESLRRRFKDPVVVDEVIALDQECRLRNFLILFSSFYQLFSSWGFYIVLLFKCVGQYELDNLRKDFNKINKEVAKLKIVSLITIVFSILVIFHE